MNIKPNDSLAGRGAEGEVSEIDDLIARAQGLLATSSVQLMRVFDDFVAMATKLRHVPDAESLEVFLHDAVVAVQAHDMVNQLLATAREQMSVMNLHLQEIHHLLNESGQTDLMDRIDRIAEGNAVVRERIRVLAAGHPVQQEKMTPGDVDLF